MWQYDGFGLLPFARTIRRLSRSLAVSQRGFKCDKPVGLNHSGSAGRLDSGNGKAGRVMCRKGTTKAARVSPGCAPGANSSMRKLPRLTSVGVPVTWGWSDWGLDDLGRSSFKYGPRYFSACCLRHNLNIFHAPHLARDGLKACRMSLAANPAGAFTDVFALISTRLSVERASA